MISEANEKVSSVGVKQRPHAEPVARQEQPAELSIPDGNGKLAIEQLEAIGAMLFVQVQNNLRIGCLQRCIRLTECDNAARQPQQTGAAETRCT